MQLTLVFLNIRVGKHGGIATALSRHFGTCGPAGGVCAAQVILASSILSKTAFLPFWQPASGTGTVVCCNLIRCAYASRALKEAGRDLIDRLTLLSKGLFKVCCRLSMYARHHAELEITVKSVVNVMGVLVQAQMSTRTGLACCCVILVDIYRM